MRKITKADLKGVPFLTFGKTKRGNYIIRKGFFYKMGYSEDKLAEALKTVLPDAVIVDMGEKFVPFRGGQTVAQGSHFWVEFSVPD